MSQIQVQFSKHALKDRIPLFSTLKEISWRMKYLIKIWQRKMSLQTDLDSRAQKESIEDKVAAKEINANLLGGE